MTGRVSDPRAPAAAREHELLARLGLGPGASNDQVEAAHDEILDFLGRAPSALRGWARVQETEVDEAYARLNGAPASSSGLEPLAPAMAVRALARTEADAGGGIDDDFDAAVDELDGPVVISRRQRTAQKPASRGASARGLAPSPPVRRSGDIVIPGSARKLAIAGVGVVLTAVLVIGVYGLGSTAVPGLTGTPKPEATSGLDTAQVSALMAKITANPKDTVSLLALGNLYYDQGDYSVAETWFQKVLGIEPQNVSAMLSMGAAQYNSGDQASAKSLWEKVLQLDAKNIEAHYDLGFMYFSEDPPNVDMVRREWGAVITLAPDSDIAQTVQAHLGSLGTPGPSAVASGAPSGGPASAPPSATGATATPSSPAPSAVAR